jgi:hypothetical protein
MKTFKQYIEACWDGYRQVGMKKKGNRMVPNCVPESFDMNEASDESQITVGDYTTKHFDICPSAVALYSKIKNMTPMVHLIVENMMLHDVFFRLEKQAMAQGLIDDDDLDKAGDYADMIMDNARQMGLEEEHSYIGDVHMKRFMELAGLDDDEEEDLDEGSETWEAGYKRRVVKTTNPEHKEKGMNWRIKGKDRPEISIKLYKEKPSQAEFNKQMRRVAGHEFGG